MTKKRVPNKLKKRPDEIVIPDDILYLVGKKRFKNDLGGKLRDEKKNIIEYHCKRNIEKQIEQAKKFIGIRNEIISPIKHQLMADSVCACVVVDMTEEISTRKDALKSLIKGAKGSARTNYQFVRNFIRRNTAGLLREKGIRLAKFDLFPLHIRKELEKGYPRRIVEKTVSIVKKEWPGIAIQIGASTAGGALLLAIQSWLSKGEFTHFEEVFPVLAALQNQTNDVRIGIMVSDPQRHAKIARDIQKKAPTMSLSHLRTKVFRYYVFPAEYLLMVAGEPGQFVVFWGNTQRQKRNITSLLSEDWNKAWKKGTTQ